MKQGGANWRGMNTAQETHYYREMQSEMRHKQLHTRGQRRNLCQPGRRTGVACIKSAAVEVLVKEHKIQLTGRISPKDLRTTW
jgi:hypothetical protein